MSQADIMPTTQQKIKSAHVLLHKWYKSCSDATVRTEEAHMELYDIE